MHPQVHPRMQPKNDTKMEDELIIWEIIEDHTRLPINRDGHVPSLIVEWLKKQTQRFQDSEGEKMVTTAGEHGVLLFWEDGKLCWVKGSDHNIDWVVPTECEEREVAKYRDEGSDLTKCIIVDTGESPTIAELERRFWMYHLVNIFKWRWNPYIQAGVLLFWEHGKYCWVKDIKQ